ncbi:MAG: hypothetical protein JSU72_01750 [Deltaproteobacteria bacterium]|nr:MAG: hypothetical protein JSU72_01750 [Deltaproteobacteria bacterium]
MDIWRFNDPEPLRPFLLTLERHSPQLADCARSLFEKNNSDGRNELTRLGQGLVHGSGTVRRAVRVLLFTPPVEDELSHFRRLLRWLPYWLPHGWYHDPTLYRLVAELVSSSESPQNCQFMATVLQVALKGRSRSMKEVAMDSSAPWQPTARASLISKLTRRLRYSLTPGLRRRLLLTPGVSPGQIYEAIEKVNRYSPSGVLRKWREMLAVVRAGQPSVLSSSFRRAVCAGSETALRIFSWGERTPEEIAYLERLISYQANELTEVAKLAMEVSKRTKRVVLTLHNASFGAATAWGVPAFPQQVPEVSAAKFAKDVSSTQELFAGNLSHPCQSPEFPTDNRRNVHVDYLFRLWSRRLVRPRLLKSLWALRVALILNELPLNEWKSLFNQGRELLNDEDYHCLNRGKGLSITFDSPAVCRNRLQDVLSWYQDKKKKHDSFLSLLWSLLVVGEEWLRTRRLSYFILPIVDKFFISSQRDHDLEYLSLFVQLTDSVGHAPLFLLIDDTAKASQPSLKLAMDRWRQRNPFLGLGVFANEGETAAAPLRTILTRASKVKLFALQALHRAHNPIPLDTLLSQRPESFLTPLEYDSSWKDNLPFLYFGTQVAPLAGPLMQTERHAPVLITSDGPVAFGAFYRNTLRQLALERLGFSEGKEPTAKDSFADLKALWQEYASLANLL